mmetsp:Transcript_99615/g.266124  ORF Transcript_99615/g.266124 Transcript_99615/m.266124 type:complete len:115 (-) Transcript_99615:7-351(-)
MSSTDAPSHGDLAPTEVRFGLHHDVDGVSDLLLVNDGPNSAFFCDCTDSCALASIAERKGLNSQAPPKNTCTGGECPYVRTFTGLALDAIAFAWLRWVTLYDIARWGYSPTTKT